MEKGLQFGQSRILQPHFSSTKGKRHNSFSERPIFLEQIDSSGYVQNGNYSKYKESQFWMASIDLTDESGCEIPIHPASYKYLRSNIPISSFAVRSEHSPPVFTKLIECDDHIY